MDVYYDYTDTANVPEMSIALGYFDGIHKGHCGVIENTVDFARKNNLKSAVVTFKDRPISFFSNTPYKNIIDFADKTQRLKHLGVDYIFALTFDEKLAKLTPQEYLQNILIKYFHPKAITTGFNHTFGANRQGTPQFLRENQRKFGYQYFEIPPVEINGRLASSTVIKNLIAEGSFNEAKSLLGYNFYVKGEVITGKQIGRTIDFPTANVLYPDNIIAFPQGVYCAHIEVNGKTYNAILNYGKKPTIQSEDSLLLEAHILDIDQDICGKQVKIIPLRYIRSEQKFCSLTELKSQIIKDAASAAGFFTSYK